MTCVIEGCKNPCLFDSSANVIGDYCRIHHDRLKFKEVLSAAAMSEAGMNFDRRREELADYHAVRYCACFCHIIYFDIISPV